VSTTCQEDLTKPKGARPRHANPAGAYIGQGRTQVGPDPCRTLCSLHRSLQRPGPACDVPCPVYAPAGLACLQSQPDMDQYRVGALWLDKIFVCMQSIYDVDLTSFRLLFDLPPATHVQVTSCSRWLTCDGSSFHVRRAACTHTHAGPDDLCMAGIF